MYPWELTLIELLKNSLLPEVVLQQSKACSLSTRHFSPPILRSCNAPSPFCTPAWIDRALDAQWNWVWSIWQPWSIRIRKGSMQESGILMFPLCLGTQDTHFSAVWVTSYQKKWRIFHVSRCLSKNCKAPFWKTYFNQVEIWSSVQNHCQSESSGTYCTQTQVIKDQIVFYEHQNLLIPVCFFLLYPKNYWYENA